MNKEHLFPKSLSKIYEGYTDQELESACLVDGGDFGFSKHWTASLYSFSKGIRSWARVPKNLPLFVFSTHGVGLSSDLRRFEQENSAKHYLCWHPLLEKRWKNSKLKKILRIPHPYIHYRRSMGIERVNSPKGTVVFYSHHVPGFKVEHGNEEYFALLNSLPEKFHPIVVCLHMHDINAGHHKNLRSYGFQIVTAGYTSSPFFVDRLYQLIRSFSFATSPSWGSQTAYCVELGVPYFFLGESKVHNISHKESPIGELKYQDKYHEEYEMKANELFAEPTDEVSKEQKEFVFSLLGLDSEVKPSELRWILYKEFVLHIPYLLKRGIERIIYVFKQHGVVGVSKKLGSRFLKVQP